MQSENSTSEFKPLREDFLPTNAFSSRIDQMIRVVGEYSSAIWVILVVTILFGLYQRHIAVVSTVFVEELQWHLYAAGIAFAMSYCLTLDTHIRLDLISHRFSKFTATWIETCGITLLLLPFIAFVFYHSIPFVERSYVQNETSLSPGGVPYRWIIKSFLPLAFFFLGLAALSRLVRCLQSLMALNRSKQEGE